MPRFLVPVDGLHLDEPWRIGPVLLLDPGTARDAVAKHAAGLPGAAGPWLVGEADALLATAWAQTEAADVDSAIRAIRDVLDLLRVFQHAQSLIKPTVFGLSGDVHASHLRYLQLDGPHLLGFRNTGDHLGFSYNSDVRAAWAANRLSALADQLGTELPPGPARALAAVRLLSRAMLEKDTSARLLNTVIAVETLLGGGGTYTIARRCVFFTCGPPQGSRCGRDRPACPLLLHDPSVKSQLAELTRLDKGLRPGDDHCSEWIGFIDRYNERSTVVHGEFTAQPSPDDVSKDLWWSIHRLLPEALSWLLQHPATPFEDLDRELRRFTAPVSADGGAVGRARGGR